MNTYHIRIEIDRHVPDDHCFYTIFSVRRTLSKKKLNEILNNFYMRAMDFIEEGELDC